MPVGKSRGVKRQFSSGKRSKITNRNFYLIPTFGPPFLRNMYDEKTCISRGQSFRRARTAVSSPPETSTTEEDRPKKRRPRTKGEDTKGECGSYVDTRRAGYRWSSVPEHVEARKWLRAHYAKSLCALFELSRALCFPVTRPGFLHARGIHLSVPRVFLAFSSSCTFLLRSFIRSFFSFLFSFLFFASSCCCRVRFWLFLYCTSLSPLFYFPFVFFPRHAATAAARLAFVVSRERVKRLFSLFFSLGEERSW